MTASLEIRVRGRVQGVGFRPNVWRLARELGLVGEVRNDGEGVLIRAAGSGAALASFVERLEGDAPDLAQVDSVETRPVDVTGADAIHAAGGEFRIVESATGSAVRTEVAPDAALCAACATEVLAAGDRRFRYPFTTCTHCGPRLSIVQSIPYDRATTTMSSFPLCASCDAEYRDPADRRFHAEATACRDCGPRVRLLHADGRAMEPAPADAVQATAVLLQQGAIVAIKGLGGYQLACDATRRDVVARLRGRKKRDAKPFALMARDVDVIRRYCTVTQDEEGLLRSAEAPIVLLPADGPEVLPHVVAPDHGMLGFMLPTTPLHLLLLQAMDRPLVMTSGNVAEAPASVDDDRALAQLATLADHLLVHDRVIANRVDDSVARVMDGRARVLRRARGYAPGALRLPPGFEHAPPLLAYGAELKSTFCLMDGGSAVLSQHQGDLDDAATLDDYRKNLTLYAEIFRHTPEVLVADLHPGYASSRLARTRAAAEGQRLIEVQHHHAHVAACLADNAWPLRGAPVLGIVLDGLGLGDDGGLWGGELLLADYRHAERLGTMKPVALIGGDQAAREPWRNLYAHLAAAMGWPEAAATLVGRDLHNRLRAKPLGTIDQMLARGLNVPLASSCGRLFDAVAAAVGIHFDLQGYEGQAAAALEALVDRGVMDEDDARVYPFTIETVEATGLPCLEPLAMWRALIADLAGGTAPGVIAARFHRGLSRALMDMAQVVRGSPGSPRFDTVALSGGCFQNRVLLEATSRALRGAGLTVITHGDVPPNDGGLALGQAAVAAARLLAGEQET